MVRPLRLLFAPLPFESHVYISLLLFYIFYWVRGGLDLVQVDGLCLCVTINVVLEEMRGGS